MSPDYPPSSRAGEQRSESAGGSLLWSLLASLVGLVLTLVMIPVGWFVSTFAAMVVLSRYFPDVPATPVPGVGPTVAFYGAILVLIVTGFTILVRPGTILAGWTLMAVLVALYVTGSNGWTTLIVTLEVMTGVFLVPASVFTKAELQNQNEGGGGSGGYKKGLVTGIVLDRWLR